VGVQSNFIGTDFHIFDAGERGKALGRTANRSSTFSTSAAMFGTAELGEEGTRGSDGTAATRKELAVVQYHMNVMGTKGPRKMTIGIPYVDLDTNEPAVWCGESMIPWCGLAAQKPSVWRVQSPSGLEKEPDTLLCL
jgi:hypothetical protein